MASELDVAYGSRGFRTVIVPIYCRESSRCPCWRPGQHCRTMGSPEWRAVQVPIRYEDLMNAD